MRTSAAVWTVEGLDDLLEHLHDHNLTLKAMANTRCVFVSRKVKDGILYDNLLVRNPACSLFFFFLPSIFVSWIRSIENLYLYEENY